MKVGFGLKGSVKDGFNMGGSVKDGFNLGGGVKNLGGSVKDGFNLGGVKDGFNLGGGVKDGFGLGLKDGFGLSLKDGFGLGGSVKVGFGLGGNEESLKELWSGEGELYRGGIQAILFGGRERERSRNVERMPYSLKGLSSSSSVKELMSSSSSAGESEKGVDVGGLRGEETCGVVDVQSVGGEKEVSDD